MGHRKRHHRWCWRRPLRPQRHLHKSTDRDLPGAIHEVTRKNSSGPFYGKGPGLFAVNCCFCFCTAGINDDHPTSGNGKLVVLTSGGREFQQHAKHAEGGDTTPTSYTQRVLSAGCTSHNSDKSKKDYAAQRGRDASGQRRASCASLSRRLSAFFESTSRPRSQSGKVRRSDTRPGDVCERAERSEGSDSGPVRKAPVSACKPLCAILLAKASVYPLSPAKADVGHLWEKLKNAMKEGLRQNCC